MELLSLQLTGFRSFNHVQLSLNPGLNVFTGENGSGKTSLLEAIYFLSRGTSFRSRDARTVISVGEKSLSVFAEASNDAGIHTSVGIERRRDRISRQQLNGETVRSSSALLAHLPVSLFTPESHRLISDGPANRRRVMDWVMFHVEPSLLETLSRYRQALRQRQVALESRAAEQITVWETQVAALGMELDRWRQGYVGELNGMLAGVTERLLGFPVTATLARGWSKDLSLGAALEKNRDPDLRQGRAIAGPHRANILFSGEALKSREHFSRGQAKVLVVAWFLVNAALLRNKIQERPLLLLDDVMSELDEARFERVFAELEAAACQTFVTGTRHRGDLPAWPAQQVFHVEQGSVKAVV